VKCISIGLVIYGVECFLVSKIDLKSFDFAVNNFLMKLFNLTIRYQIIAECQRYFGSLNLACRAS